MCENTVNFKFNLSPNQFLSSIICGGRPNKGMTCNQTLETCCPSTVLTFIFLSTNFVKWFHFFVVTINVNMRDCSNKCSHAYLVLILNQYNIYQCAKLIRKFFLRGFTSLLFQEVKTYVLTAAAVILSRLGCGMKSLGNIPFSTLRNYNYC